VEEATREQIGQRSGQHSHRSEELIRRRAAGWAGPKSNRQSVHGAVQTRIRAEHLDQWLGRNEPPRYLRHLIDGKKQQRVALLELAALRPANRGKAVLVCPKFRG